MKEKLHILIVDDDRRICNLLKKFFEKEDFLVSIALNVDEAENLISYLIFDLIVLDVMLPRVTGIDFAKILKAKYKDLPIVLLTALGEVEHRIERLESGADDYLVKPIDPKELLLRIKKLIELYAPKDRKIIGGEEMTFGSNVYNYNYKELRKTDGTKIVLSSTESRFLEFFVEKYGTIFNREELSKIFGIEERSIDVNIARLRNKIEKDPKTPKHFQTVRNEGYIFNL